MELEVAERLMRSKMAEYHLTDEGWTFAWCKHRTAAGWCVWSHRQIRLSTFLVPRFTDYAVTDTVLHEVAHALYGRPGHSARWRKVFIDIGGSGKRTWDQEQVLEGVSVAPWSAQCPTCGNRYFRHRRPTSARYCLACVGHAAFETFLVWFYEGQLVPLEEHDPRYRVSVERQLGAAACGPVVGRVRPVQTSLEFL